jgi:hypothetical protein
MDIKIVSIVSGTALLALTAAASAGPMSATSTKIIASPIPIEQASYQHRHHYMHYGWHRTHHGLRYGWHGRGWHYGWWYPQEGDGWRYGWHYGWYPHTYAYDYGYPYDYGYGYGTGLAALATAPLAAGAAVTEPLMTGRSVAAAGNYCSTPEKTCLLKEPGWVGTGCSCKVPGGRARGTVVEQAGEQ